MTDTTTQAVHPTVRFITEREALYLQRTALLAERDALAAQLADALDKLELEKALTDGAHARARDSALDALAAYGQAADAHEAQLAAEQRLATAGGDVTPEVGTLRELKWWRAARRQYLREGDHFTIESDGRDRRHPRAGEGRHAMTPTPEEVAALVKRLTDRCEREFSYDRDCDEAAAALTALQARAEAAEARVRELEEAAQAIVTHASLQDRRYLSRDLDDKLTAMRAALTPDTPAR